MHQTLLLAVLCTLGRSLAQDWTFSEATLTVQPKQGAAQRHAFQKDQPVSKPVILGDTDTLKLLLTTTAGASPQRADQTFLHLEAPQELGLETSFALTTKNNGKARLELSQKDIPLPLLHAAASGKGALRASLMLGSFDSSSSPLNVYVFDLVFASDPAAPWPALPTPERYSRQPEINHIFKEDPRSPPVVITLIFSIAVLFALPLLFVAWASLGANLRHAAKAFDDAPLPHALFFGSIVAMEGVFMLYYSHWKLYHVLPSALAVGLVTFFSGSRALREVQQRRLSGHR